MDDRQQSQAGQLAQPPTKINITLIKDRLAWELGEERWTQYWTGLRKFLRCRLSRIEFEEIAREALLDQVFLHNHLMRAIVHNAYVVALPHTPDVLTQRAAQAAKEEQDLLRQQNTQDGILEPSTSTTQDREQTNNTPSVVPVDTPHVYGVGAGGKKGRGMGKKGTTASTAVAAATLAATSASTSTSSSKKHRLSPLVLPAAALSSAGTGGGSASAAAVVEERSTGAKKRRKRDGSAPVDAEKDVVEEPLRKAKKGTTASSSQQQQQQQHATMSDVSSDIGDDLRDQAKGKKHKSSHVKLGGKQRSAKTFFSQPTLMSVVPGGSSVGSKFTSVLFTAYLPTTGTSTCDASLSHVPMIASSFLPSNTIISIRMRQIADDFRIAVSDSSIEAIQQALHSFLALILRHALAFKHAQDSIVLSPFLSPLPLSLLYPNHATTTANHNNATTALSLFEDPNASASTSDMHPDMYRFHQQQQQQQQLHNNCQNLSLTESAGIGVEGSDSQNHNQNHHPMTTTFHHPFVATSHTHNYHAQHQHQQYQHSSYPLQQQQQHVFAHSSSPAFSFMPTQPQHDTLATSVMNHVIDDHYLYHQQQISFTSPPIASQSTSSSSGIQQQQQQQPSTTDDTATTTTQHTNDVTMKDESTADSDSESDTDMYNNISSNNNNHNNTDHYNNINNNNSHHYHHQQQHHHHHFTPGFVTMPEQWVFEHCNSLAVPGARDHFTSHLHPYEDASICIKDKGELNRNPAIPQVQPNSSIISASAAAALALANGNGRRSSGGHVSEEESAAIRRMFGEWDVSGKGDQSPDALSLVNVWQALQARPLAVRGALRNSIERVLCSL